MTETSNQTPHSAESGAIWREAFDDLKAELAVAQDERPQRGNFPQGGELGWVRHERQVMTDLVNTLRARRGVGPVSMDAVKSKEQLAVGHIDYTTKWAIGCADLVTTDRPEDPR